jgi:signal transduction histidine kinase
MRDERTLRPDGFSGGNRATNCKTTEAMQDSVSELRNLQQITETLLSLAELPQVMNTVAEGIVTHLGYDIVLVSRYIEEESTFSGLAIYPTPTPRRIGRFLKTIDRPELKKAPTQFRLPYERGDNPILDRVLDGEVMTSDSMADFFHPWVPRPAAVLVQEIFGIQAYVDLPMRVRGKTVGTIVAGVRSGPITAEQKLALGRVADQAAVALENARLHKAERQRAAELARSNAFVTALSQVAARMGITPDPDQVLETLGAEISGLDITCFLTLLDPDTQELFGRYTSIESTALKLAEKLAGISVRNLRVSRERWPILEIIERGQAVFAADPVELLGKFLLHIPKPVLKRIAQLIGMGPDVGVVYLPLAVGEQLGVLTLWGPDLREEDIPALSVFANQVAVALENARLYDLAQRELAERFQAEAEVRQRALEQKTLRQAALALTTTLDRDEVIDRILAQLQEVVPYNSASVQLLRGCSECTQDAGSRDEGYLEIVGGRGFPNLEDLLGVCFPLDGTNPNHEVVRSRAHFIVEDAPAVYDGFHQGPHIQTPIRSWLGVPMLVGERLIGIIVLDRAEPGFYTESHARLAEAFAAQAAIAVENSRLFHAERAQREITEALEKAAAAVSSTLELDQVLDRILEQAEQITGGDVINIMLVQDGGVAQIVRQRGHRQKNTEVADADLPIHEYANLASMMRTGEAVVIPDTAADPNWITRPGEKWLRSHAGAPVRMRGQVVGFLSVASTIPGFFTLAHGQILQAFANHAATAIENARLYQQLREHAGQLEQRVQERTSELQAQYARLDAILRSTADGIIVTDGVGNVIQANPVAQAWLTQTLSPDEADRLQETVQVVATRMGEQQVELLELTGLDLELTGAPISRPGGEALQVEPGDRFGAVGLGEAAHGEPAAVVVVHDVSHLKALDRMKTRFITNISHELRTPITTVKLYADLMQRQPGSWSQYLGALTQEANHLAHLVEDILEISRVDAGRLALEFRPTSLDTLTAAAVANHRALAQEQGVTLETRSLEKAGVPVALVDPDAMAQVMGNLIENAIRFTPEGGRVVVATRVQDADGRQWAAVTVSDAGIGIPEEELPHIFDRFFRGAEPRAMQLTGTGLGLAMVKEIVDLHGGHVTVESEKSVGSAFTVWLPAVDGD